jgi:hypothetical protein
VAGFARASFLELEPIEQHWVLARAQELKTGSPPASGTAALLVQGERKTAAMPSPVPENPDQKSLLFPHTVPGSDPACPEAVEPWWMRAGQFLHRALRWSVTGVWF